MLPVGGVIVGIVALVIAGYAAVGLSKVKTNVLALDEKVAKIDEVASQTNAATAMAEKAAKDIVTLTNSTQSAVTQIAGDLGTIHDQIKHLQEPPKILPAAHGRAGRGAHETAVAGPGEYIVKAGDTGHKIAVSLGVSITDLKEVNPSVNWTKLKIGDKIKVPDKKGSAPAAAAPATP